MIEICVFAFIICIVPIMWWIGGKAEKYGILGFVLFICIATSFGFRAYMKNRDKEFHIKQPIILPSVMREKLGAKYNVNDASKTDNIKMQSNNSLSPAFAFTGTWIWEFPGGSHTVTFKNEDSKCLMLVSDGRQFEASRMINGKLRIHKLGDATFTQSEPDKWTYGTWVLVKKKE